MKILLLLFAAILVICLASPIHAFDINVKNLEFNEKQYKDMSAHITNITDIFYLISQRAIGSFDSSVLQTLEMLNKQANHTTAELENLSITLVQMLQFSIDKSISRLIQSFTRIANKALQSISHRVEMSIEQLDGIVNNTIMNNTEKMFQSMVGQIIETAETIISIVVLSATLSVLFGFVALNVYWSMSNKYAAATVSFIVLISTVFLFLVDSAVHIFGAIHPPKHKHSPILAVQVTMLQIMLMTAVCSAVTSAMHVALWLDDVLFLHDTSNIVAFSGTSENSCLYNLQSNSSSRHTMLINVVLVVLRACIGIACFFITAALIIIPVVLLQEACLKYYSE